MYAIDRLTEHQSWITLVFIFALVLLFLMKLYNPNRLFGYFFAFFNQGFIEKRLEERTSIFNIFQILLYLFSSTTIAILISFIYFEKPNFLNFTFIFTVIAVYILLRNFLDFTLETILDLETKTRYFRLLKLGYLYTSCLWIFPFCILYQYGFSNTFIILGISFFVLLIRFTLVVANNKNLIFSKFFYFILYICTLEIVPLLILYKTTTR